MADFIASARADPELTYLLPGIVPDRGRLLVVAPPNAGKTWLALAIAKAACGAGRPVFFIEEEGSRRKLGERLELMGMPAGASFQISHLGGLRLDEAPTLKALVEKLKDAQRPMMVLDPLTSLWSGDENETSHANRLRSCLDALANANPSALLVVLHHTSKAAANGDGHEINAARGSSVFGAWADVQLNLSHADGGKDCIALSVKVAKNRDGERGQRGSVRIDLDNGEVTLDNSKDAADELAERILASLRDAPGGLTKNGVARCVKGKRATVLDTVDALLSAGRITKVGDGFRLPEVKP
ncbi:MAG: AAA family ATPase [Myxococcus sp.]|nr:AAA family ATPase [Myxococcus sp.]